MRIRLNRRHRDRDERGAFAIMFVAMATMLLVMGALVVDFGMAYVNKGHAQTTADASVLAAVWQDPNVVQGEEVLVAEMDGRIVGCATVEDRGSELELVNIDVLLQLQGRGIGTMLVRSVEVRARAEGKEAVTAGTSRNAEGVAWRSLPWWQHLGYQVTHEEVNAWTRSIGPEVREIRLRKELPTE